jgi:hypothetical protein
VTTASLLDTLEAAGLVRPSAGAPEPTYVFRHALMQDAAYGSLVREERRQLHLAVAEVLEEVAADRREEIAETLARHYSAADVPAKAVHYHVSAAKRAAAAFANREAIEHYRATLVQLPRLAGGAPELRLTTDEGLGDLCVRSGELTDAIAAYGDALTVAVGPSATRGRLLRKRGLAEQLQRRQDDAVASFGAAVAALPDAERQDDQRTEWIDVTLAAAQLHYFRNKLGAMAAALAEAAPVVHGYGTERQRSRFFMLRALSSLRANRFIASAECLDDAEGGAREWRACGDPTDSELCLFVRGFCHLWAGNLDEAERGLLESSERSERVGDAITQARCWAYLTVVSRRRGHLAETEERIERALFHARAGNLVEYYAIAEGNQAWLAWRRGDRTAFLSAAQASLAHFAKLPARYIEWIVRLVLLADAVEREDLASALREAATLMDPSQQQDLGPEFARAARDGLAAGARDDKAAARSALERAVEAMKRSGYL